MRSDCRSFPDARSLSACPICKSTDLQFYVVGRDRHYGIEGHFSTDKCANCGLVFLNPMPSTDDLAHLYPKNYYSYDIPVVPSRLSRLFKCALGLSRQTALPYFKVPGVMLDVGCGAGVHLMEMKTRGWKVYGLELSEEAATVGRSAGLDIRCGELMGASFDSEMFDFIRLNHSFEHMTNPDEVLQEIGRLLKKDGKLFIGVPNIGGLMPRIFGVYWWHLCIPVHTFNYNPANLRTLLERHGFVVNRTRYYSDYGGLLGSLQIYLNRNTTPGNSNGPLLRNWLFKLFAHYVSRLFDAVRLGDCIELVCSRVA